MTLKRNYTFTHDGVTFHYLAASGRLQAYLPATNEWTGVREKFAIHLDEINGDFESQAAVRNAARKWFRTGTDGCDPLGVTVEMEREDLRNGDYHGWSGS